MAAKNLDKTSHGSVRRVCAKEERKQLNKAWVDVKKKLNVPLSVCVCACVCLVAPEFSLLGGDGERQEEKEKNEKKICQLATVVRVWGPKK